MKPACCRSHSYDRSSAPGNHAWKKRFQGQEGPGEIDIQRFAPEFQFCRQYRFAIPTGVAAAPYLQPFFGTALLSFVITEILALK
ncbi:MAG: hypothetical protein WB696_16205 [Chthoniobacterales bacterium]